MPTVLEEGLTCELGAVVSDDPVGDSEMTHQASDKLDGGLRRDLPDWLHFRPLGEFVDGDV